MENAMPEDLRIDYHADRIRRDIERQLPEMAERRLRIMIQQIIPYRFFTAPSRECRELYVHGLYYGCISLCQAVAEGLSKMITAAYQMKKGKDFDDRVKRLLRTRLITPKLADAFKAIHGNDRDDFHHLNETIEQDVEKLKLRAEECLNNLYQIESDLFTCSISDDGSLVPANPKYWPVFDEKSPMASFRSL